MSITSVTSSSQGTLQNGGTLQSASTQGQLGMQDFFTLLAAQLQYQNPMSPTDNDQFMQEMASFGSLEQLTTIASNYNFIMGSGVIGKNVSYSSYNPTDGKTYMGSGVVETVDFSSGSTPVCKIGDQWVDLSDITQISAGGSADSSAGSSTQQSTESSL